MEGRGSKGRGKSGTWDFNDGRMCLHLGADDSCFLFYEEKGTLKAGPRNDDPRWEVLQVE